VCCTVCPQLLNLRLQVNLKSSGIPVNNKNRIFQVLGELLGVRGVTGHIEPIAQLTAKTELYIYEPIQVTPSLLILPYDPLAKVKYEVPVSATGGDGTYTWSSAKNSIAVVTQRGLVKTELNSIGSTNITAAMSTNPAIRGSCMVSNLSQSVVPFTHTYIYYIYN